MTAPVPHKPHTVNHARLDQAQPTHLHAEGQCRSFHWLAPRACSSSSSSSDHKLGPLRGVCGVAGALNDQQLALLGRKVPCQKLPALEGAVADAAGLPGGHLQEQLMRASCT